MLCASTYIESTSDLLYERSKATKVLYFFCYEWVDHLNIMRLKRDHESVLENSKDYLKFRYSVFTFFLAFVSLRIRLNAVKGSMKQKHLWIIETTVMTHRDVRIIPDYCIVPRFNLLEFNNDKA